MFKSNRPKISGIQISFSAAEKYITSSMSYFLHYLLKLRPTETGSALVFGNSVDKALNTLISTKDPEKAKKEFESSFKFIDGKDARKIGNVKYSQADFDESLVEDVEVPAGHDKAWYSLLEKGKIIIDAYNVQVIPKIKEIHAIQHRLETTNANGDTFIGIVDLIVTWEDGRRLLIDNKTASKKYDDNAVSESSQLATYWEILKDEFKLDGVGFLVIPKGIRKKKEPRCEIQILTGQVTEELIQKTFAQYDQVLTGIKSGQFECTRKKEGGCCSKFWGACPYKNYCESNGKDLTGLEYKFRI